MTDTSDVRAMVIDTTARVFDDLCTREVREAVERGEWPAELWRALDETGMTLAWVSEEAGGAGLSFLDVFALIRATGRYGAPVPLAETLLASHLLAAAGLEVPVGPLTVAPVTRGDSLRLERAGDTWTLSGTAGRVPWARHAAGVVLTAEHEGRTYVALARPGPSQVLVGENLASHPRDGLLFDAVALSPADVAEAPEDVDSGWLYSRGALARAALMAGGLEGILELTALYCADRVQFGRPIGRFQAVQQEVALMAAEAAAAGMAADVAVAAAATSPALLEIAAAKVRTGEAVGTAAAIAHQVHGAIGFTYEHQLHWLTRSLWAWRDELGNETEWASLLGRSLIAAGPDSAWQFVTSS